MPRDKKRSMKKLPMPPREPMMATFCKNGEIIILPMYEAV
jgi:hypothetical protein